jgi:hypothetical protein
VSVRKVVPTLTSRSAEIYLSMAGAKQLVTLGFILVTAGAVRPAGVCSGHYIVLHCSACRGGLQARQERRSGLQVSEVLIEASANIVVKTKRVRVSALCRRPPSGQGTAPPFIGQGGGSLQACRTVLATCGGMAHSIMEWTAVLANLASDRASWRALCLSRSGFESGGVGDARSVAARVLIRGCR